MKIRRHELLGPPITAILGLITALLILYFTQNIFLTVFAAISIGYIGGMIVTNKTNDKIVDEIDFVGIVNKATKNLKQ